MPALLKEPELRRSIEAYMYALYKGTSMVINAVGRSQALRSVLVSRRAALEMTCYPGSSARLTKLKYDWRGMTRGAEAPISFSDRRQALQVVDLLDTKKPLIVLRTRGSGVRRDAPNLSVT
jgi:hypothetical protein